MAFPTAAIPSRLRLESLADALGPLTSANTVSLSEVNPPKIVKWFLYGHPTMLERIHFLDSYKTSNKID